MTLRTIIRRAAWISITVLLTAIAACADPAPGPRAIGAASAFSSGVWSKVITPARPATRNQLSPGDLKHRNPAANQLCSAPPNIGHAHCLRAAGRRVIYPRGRPPGTPEAHDPRTLASAVSAGLVSSLAPWMICHIPAVLRGQAIGPFPGPSSARCGGTVRPPR